jgi:hypothetical protein
MTTSIGYLVIKWPEGGVECLVITNQTNKITFSNGTQYKLFYSKKKKGLTLVNEEVYDSEKIATKDAQCCTSTNIRMRLDDIATLTKELHEKASTLTNLDMKDDDRATVIEEISMWAELIKTHKKNLQSIMESNFRHTIKASKKTTTNKAFLKPGVQYPMHGTTVTWFRFTGNPEESPICVSKVVQIREVEITVLPDNRLQTRMLKELSN